MAHYILVQGFKIRFWVFVGLGRSFVAPQ